MAETNRYIPPEGLRILHLEDIPEDSMLVDRELQKAGMDFQKILVDTRDDFIRALKEFDPHVVLSDHSLPSFNSQEALSLMRELGVLRPMILVTATVSEEYAVQIIKEGASDYVLKDRLQRLPNAVANAIRSYALEQERLRADAELRASEKKYKLLFDANPLAMWMARKQDRAILDVNDAALRQYGYDRQTFLSLRMKDLLDEGDFGQERDGDGRMICRHRVRGGKVIWVEMFVHDIRYGEQEALLVLANDITERIRAEEQLSAHRKRQEKLLAQTSIRAQEKVREEIGRELHDNINQILASTKLYLESAIAEPEEEFTADLLHKSLKGVTDSIREIRQLSHHLVAPALRKISVKQAIQHLLAEISGRNVPRLELEATNFREEPLDHEVRLSCYRIVQEQVNNILKHARASEGRVELRSEGDQALLIIRDNGIGFDPEKTDFGIGLRNIAQRAALYNGIMQLHAAPGNGCTLEIRFPVR